ncbi:MAG: transglutaminase domain-containing protein [Planctomycetes bacterium]|nr:transglutaminase domain-containing protein [Planctomycetota bacterium]
MRVYGGTVAGFGVGVLLVLSSGCGGGGGGEVRTTHPPAPRGLLDGPLLAGAVEFEVSDQYLIRGIPQGARSVECRIPLPVPSRGCTISRPAIACPADHDVRGVLTGASPVTVAVRDPGVAEMTVTLRYACESHAVSAARGPAAVPSGAARGALRPYQAAGAREGVTAEIRALARLASRDHAELASRAGALLACVTPALRERPGAGPNDAYFSLCRAAGIACRLQSGVRLAREGSTPKNWVECYLGGIGWVPVDAERPSDDPASGLGGIGAGYVPYSDESFAVTVDGAPHADWRRGISSR